MWFGLTVPFSVGNLSEMASIGLGLPRETFKDAGRYGHVCLNFFHSCLATMKGLTTPPGSPHLLAPTASDLEKYGEKDTILAGFHTDLNFLTIHGRSRYPGLNIWARNTGKRIPVKFPSTGRYLLVQAGKQLEHLSGGLVKAGYHEVVVNDATLQVRTHSIGMLLAVDRITSFSRPSSAGRLRTLIDRLSGFRPHSSGICLPTMTSRRSRHSRIAPVCFGRIQSISERPTSRKKLCTNR